MISRNGRLPFTLDVTCNHGNTNDLIMTSNYVVTLNEFNFGFAEVNGLNRDNLTDEIREGGNSYPLFIKKYSYSFEQIEFKKGLEIKKSSIASTAIKTALSQAAFLNNNILREAAILGTTALDSTTTLEQGPAIGYIQIYDKQFKDLQAAFRFFSLGASRWEITPLGASGTEVMYESITLMCKNLQRLPVTLKQSGIWNTFGQNQHQYYEISPEEVTEHKETYTRFLGGQTAGQSKNESLINAAKKIDSEFQTDKTTRIELFEEYQKTLRKKREEETQQRQSIEEEIEKSKIDREKWQEDTRKNRKKELEDLQKKENEIEESKKKK